VTLNRKAHMGEPADQGDPAGSFEGTASMRLRKPDRQRSILSELEQAPSLRVGDLAQRLRVSTETIRRDLAELTDRGLLNRTYGGAVRPAPSEPGVNERHSLFTDERQRIARAAVPLLAGARHIVMGSGATTTHVARRIAVEMTNITVITHAFGIATVLSLNPTISVIVAPGLYHPGEGAMHGAQTLRFLEDFAPDWCVTGASGLAPDGPSDALIEMAEVYAAMVRRSVRRMVVADHSKHDHRFPARYAAWDAIDALVTDRAPEALLARSIDAAGVRVSLA
jgi:DeoR/GlpR family transcriptional regulator of sugar metabolism